MEINQDPNSTNNLTNEETGAVEMKFPQYPLIGRYNLGTGILELYEKEYDNTNPYQSMPYMNITDEGVVQVFYKKGTFTEGKDEDLPEFRCFPERITTHRLPGYAEGPFRRRILEYPNGYYNPPKRKIRYRFRMRINPEQILFRIGTYKSLTPLEKKLCRKNPEPFAHKDPKKYKYNYRELLCDLSQLSIEELRKVFCSGKYKLSRYVRARLRGKAKSDSMLRKLSQGYLAGKFRYNHITRKVDQIKPFNKTELARAEKAAKKEKPVIELKDIPYVLEVRYTRLHPIAKKFSIVKRNNENESDKKNKQIDWRLFQGTWIPPKLYPEKKQNRIKFQQLPTIPSTDPNNHAPQFKQIRIYDPGDPEYKEMLRRKRKTDHTAHPLGRLLKNRLDKGQNSPQDK